MNLDTARQYGKACGLETDAEAINNIFGHAMCIFPYEDVNTELDELCDDAKNNGIRFCPNCGMAQIEKDKCYMEERGCENNPQA